MENLLFLIAIIILVLASGFFSASESALFSLSSIKIKTYQQNPHPRYRLIATLVLHPRELLVTVFMLNTLVNILLQNATSHLSYAGGGWALKVGVPLVLILFMGEIIPKYIALVNNTSVAYGVAPAINFFQNLLAPLRHAIIAVTAPLSRFLFFFLKKEKTISKEELQHMLKTSEKYGLLHAEEAELIDGYLNLQDAQTKELMRPREEILFYDIQTPLSNLIGLLVDQECSRLPICDKNIDAILGIVSARDFFLQRETMTSKTENVNKSSKEALLKIVEKPLFIPETLPALLLLYRLDVEEKEMALVVNEYGSISGLITYEDLIEIVIGEIKDRRDRKELYTRAADQVIIASGKLELSELEELFGAKLISSNNMITIGGWLTEQLGHIPQTGTKYETKDFLFKVLEAKPNRVTRVYIRKKENC